MRIGIDCRTILSEQARFKAGVAHYVYYLVKNLLQVDRENEYVLFWPSTSSGSKEFYSLSERRRVEGLPRMEIRFVRYDRYKKFLPYVYSHILIANQIKQAKLDVFHSPANIVPLSLLRGKHRPKIVVTIHDLAIYRHPEWFPKGQGFSIKYLVPQTIKLVDRIIVPSQATKRDLTELFQVPENKITVIPHGVERRFFRNGERLATSEQRPGAQNPNRQSQIASRYILFVGTLEPRKNLVRLIQAYAGLPREIIDQYDLVIAGQRGWRYQEILEAISDQRSAIRDKIKVLGYYPGAKLPELMKGASVFCYPSLYEGFGLPVLEAMAAGCPVVTGNNTSSAEIALNCAVLVNSSSTDEIRAGIVKLIRDKAYASQISAAALERARQFTWQRAAEQTSQVYLA